MLQQPAADRDPSSRPLAAGLTLLAGVLAVVIRLVPHPANLSPVGALGLFGGARLASWKAFLYPVAVMLVSDFGLWTLTGFDFKYSPLHVSRAYVYGSFLLYVAIGRLLRDKASPAWVFGASLLGSLQFFLVTNFFDWLFQPLQTVPEAFRYTRDLSGLMNCYVAALPFFQGESPLSLHAIVVGDPRYSLFGLVVGDLLFTGVLFGLHTTLARAAFPAEQVPAEPKLQATNA